MVRAEGRPTHACGVAVPGRAWLRAVAGFTALALAACQPPRERIATTLEARGLRPVDAACVGNDLERRLTSPSYDNCAMRCRPTAMPPALACR